jgi:hypothetical protein
VKGLWDNRRDSHRTGVRRKCRSAQNDNEIPEYFIGKGDEMNTGNVLEGLLIVGGLGLLLSL